MKLAYVDCVELIILDVSAFLYFLHFSFSFFVLKICDFPAFDIFSQNLVSAFGLSS